MITAKIVQTVTYAKELTREEVIELLDTAAGVPADPPLDTLSNDKLAELLEAAFGDDEYVAQHVYELIEKDNEVTDELFEAQAGSR